jgi:hypothetical protein
MLLEAILRPSRLDMEAIERRIANAAPGPWRRGIGNESNMVYGLDDRPVIWGSFAHCAKNQKDCAMAINSGCSPRDGSFIAHAREDIELLIARVRELEKDADHQRVNENILAREHLTARLRANPEWVFRKPLIELIDLACDMEFHRAFDCAELALRESMTEACKAVRKESTPKETGRKDVTGRPVVSDDG